MNRFFNDTIFSNFRNCMHNSINPRFLTNLCEKRYAAKHKIFRERGDRRIPFMVYQISDHRIGDYDYYMKYENFHMNRSGQRFNII